MKVRFIDTKFVTNDEKKTVTCIIMAELKPTSQQNLVGLSKPWDDILDRFTVHGCAKCHPDDKYSLEIGKRIAESRAKKRIYQVGKEKALKLIRCTDIFKMDLEKMANSMDSFKKKEDQHIEVVQKDIEANDAQ